MSGNPNGTRSAETIRASGLQNRDNRPDTRPHLISEAEPSPLATQEPSQQDITRGHHLGSSQKRVGTPRPCNTAEFQTKRQPGPTP
jgi:hypothetical protein